VIFPCNLCTSLESIKTKTNKETEMVKTENMKTTMKQLAAGTFIALILLVGNVKAEGTEVKASGHESIETSLQLENWMTNEAIWNTNTANDAVFVQETETKLDLENWMTNSDIWNSSYKYLEESETGMSLESWMMNEKIWDLNSMDSESELLVENWMTDKNIWR